MSPAEEKALLQQGIAAARAGDKTAARARFRELTGKNFDNELAWLWLASVADTPAHAMACLRRVLQINDGNDKARAALFRLLMEKGIEAARVADKPSAYALFQEASTLDASSELVWTWLASTAPTPAQALDALRRVLQLNPTHDQASRAFKKLIVQQSVDLAQAGDPAARDLLTEATTVDPENETLWLWLARSVSASEAVALYERVLQINPEHEAARAALRQLRPEPVIAMAPIAEPDLAFEPSDDSDFEPDLDGHLDAGLDAEADLEPLAPMQASSPHAIDLSQLHFEQADDVDDAVAVVEDAAGEEAVDADEADEDERDAAVTYGPPPVPLSAAPAEEFVVYHGADISAVWAADAADATHASGSAAPAVETMAYGAEVDSYVAASEQDYADSQPSYDLSSAATSVAIADEPVNGHAYANGHEIAADIELESTALSAFAPAAVAVMDRASDDVVAGDGGASAEEAVETIEPSAAAEAASGAAGATPSSAPVSNAPIAWHCPICLGGAPADAVRCPTCRSVVSLDDPDLLLQTDDVDRRHVLQVVARLKNRAAATFDHQFTLGLAYVNAGRITEGIGALRAASQLRPRDINLKAQIDGLERAAANGVRRAAAKSSAASAPSAPSSPAAASTAVPYTNGHAAKTPAAPVELPMAPRADEPGADGSTSAADLPIAGSSESRRVILVVDDSPTIQKVVSVTLEAHGHEVVTASDGMEALSKLRTVKPDLVLLDITMPHMDGYQLCRILRSNDLTRSVPIVMLSGKDGLFDKMRGRMAGAASYITKPFAPSALPPLVEKLCKRAG